MIRKGIVILFLSLHFLEGLDAQVPPTRGGRGDGTGIPDFETADSRSQDEFAADIDTFGVFYFNVDNPNRETPFSDSLLNNFQQYDPVRQRALDLKHLGNLGSAHSNIVYEPLFRRGFDVGLHQYDAYMVTGMQLPFYRLEKPYTNLSYTLGSEQSDGYLTAQFSRNFASGLNTSVDYRRISQLGTRSQYPNQNSRNTALAFGMWLHGKGGRYDGFLSHAANTIEQEDNGGIVQGPAEGEEFSSPSSAQVFLDNGQTRHQHREWMYTHYYKFGGKPDSLKGIRRAYTLSHQISHQKSAYKFFDPYSNADTSFFDRFPSFLVDDRGMRVFLEHRKIENSFRISTYKLTGGQKNRPVDQRDLLEVGLTHTWHDLRFEPMDSVINNLFATGRWNIHPGPALRLETYGHLGFWDNGGDYRVSGELFIDLKKLGGLAFMAASQLYKPNLIQHRFFLSQREVWNNDFERTLETNLSASYALPQFDLEITGRYHLINNFIYFDTTGLPRQTGIPISIAQLIVKKNFRVWHLHLDNTVALQRSTQEQQIRLPSVFSKHSFYYAGKWFGVLNVHLGVDVRFNDTYFGDYYNPVTGQFQLQNSRAVTFFPAADAFFGMQVAKFRAFFKMENFTSNFRDDLFYQTAFYAHPEAVTRLGIKWRLVN
jgi:hypothetical protein